jgi:hypothetical protein
MWAPSRRRSLLLLSLVVLPLAATDTAFVRAAQSSPGLDFGYYRTNIEPIFLKARAPDEREPPVNAALIVIQE